MVIPIEMENGDIYDVQVFEEPIPNEIYYVGVDPSGGLGKDRS